MDQRTQDFFDDFVAVIEETIGLIGDIAQVESDKAEAASLKQHHLMDGYIQEEQAQILKLRGLEQRRIRLAKELGWDSLTFRQILSRVSLRQSSRLQPLFEELEEQLKWLQDSRSAAERMIKVRLHEMDIVLARQNGSAYDDSGSINPGPPLHSVMRDTYV